MSEQWWAPTLVAVVLVVIVLVVTIVSERRARVTVRRDVTDVLAVLTEAFTEAKEAFTEIIRRQEDELEHLRAENAELRRKTPL